MSDTVITVEGLGKKYIIGHQQPERYVALRDVLANSVRSLGHRLRGKHYPGSAHEEFWALKDVSFEVQRGDRVGIIGRNGAGKSTLLKILSRITEPSTGRIAIKGRVASLLEVGTGFHPELTGRENIFLNGALLGMSQVELRLNFDEIVAFAEVEKFLDTPVKRYSSGMYVRLAFAVAAHLEPEILVVDEVLAVGDLAFQKKCLGKMEDIAEKEGRTILFVSHNMAAIEAFCSKGIFLEKGSIRHIGKVDYTILEYQRNILQNLQENSNEVLAFSSKNQIGSKNLNTSISKSTEHGIHLKIEFSVFSEKPFTNVGVGISITTLSGIRVSTIGPSVTNYIIRSLDKTKKCIFECSHIEKYLAGGEYILGVWLSRPKIEYLLKFEDAKILSLPSIDVFGTGAYFEADRDGLVPLPVQYCVQDGDS